VTLYEALQATLVPPIRHVWRVQVRGHEHVPDTGPGIVVANHESQTDPFFLGAAFERQLHFVAKEELWALPAVGWILAQLGGIPVGRGRGDREAMGAAEERLRTGELVAMFPQGTTIPRPDRVWLRGAARLALATGAPLIPVALVHTERVLRPVRPKVGLPSVVVLIGEPISVAPGPATISAARRLTADVRAAVEDLRAPFGPPAHVPLVELRPRGTPSPRRAGRAAAHAPCDPRDPSSSPRRRAR
jgi:1-acyl-sn-glycerol-3-phosphate acyltransferase